MLTGFLPRSWKAKQERYSLLSPQPKLGAVYALAPAITPQNLCPSSLAQHCYFFKSQTLFRPLVLNYGVFILLFFFTYNKLHQMRTLTLQHFSEIGGLNVLLKTNYWKEHGKKRQCFDSLSSPISF